MPNDTIESIARRLTVADAILNIVKESGLLKAKRRVKAKSPAKARKPRRTGLGSHPLENVPE